MAGRETVRLKKYFYSLRPALALRWLRSNAAMPPMDLPASAAGIEEEFALAEREGGPGGGDPAPLDDANAAFRDIVAGVL